MPDYECPTCGGGFPENPDRKCPWCGERIDGSLGPARGTSGLPGEPAFPKVDSSSSTPTPDLPNEGFLDERVRRGLQGRAPKRASDALTGEAGDDE